MTWFMNRKPRSQPWISRREGRKKENSTMGSKKNFTIWVRKKRLLLLLCSRWPLFFFFSVLFLSLLSSSLLGFICRSWFVWDWHFEDHLNWVIRIACCESPAISTLDNFNSPCPTGPHLLQSSLSNSLFLFHFPSFFFFYLKTQIYTIVFVLSIINSQILGEEIYVLYVRWNKKQK